ncbi:hypothetical protein VPH35_135933 [Triticum aestivum]|uniref:Uncharacterized protein n=1 Tax=Aegilops tauschii TaxID=37682 RepID=N1QQ09_AEGTA
MRDELAQASSLPLPKKLMARVLLSPTNYWTTTDYSDGRVTTRVYRQNKEDRQDEPPAIFPEDVLIEILSQVPYISLCRFKCVSKQWLALCSDSSIRKRSPQAMSGFFYKDHSWRFHNLSRKGPLLCQDN